MKVVNWFCAFFFLKECCLKCDGWFCVRADGEWGGLEMRTCERCGDNPDRKYSKE